MIKARELIEYLEGFDGDTEVRIMQQPGWPFENAIEGFWHTVSKADDDESESFEADRHFEPAGDYAFEPAKDGRTVIYLLEGIQMAYGTADAWEQNEY